MLKRTRRKLPEKDKLSQELFQFNRTAEHGFPHKASALAYDPKLHLLAIGTRTGFLKIFGKIGVEFSAHHTIETCIQQLFFYPGQGRIISVCDDGELNTLHLWEINNRSGRSILEEVKACTLEGSRLKKISVCCLSVSRECLYIGTEGGHIYVLDLNSFELKDHIIYQDIVVQSLQGDESRGNAGSVEGLLEHPTDHSKLLIGYRKGIIAMWNQDKIKVERSFVANQDLEGLHWHPNATQFISAHEHGTLSIWTIPDREDGEVIQETSTPFGPFPCKAIRKVEWHEPFVFFSGGLPRANYGDKHCVSMMNANTVQVVFDFTSKVIDFLTIRSTASDHEPIALAVLCEEEFVLLDLKAEEQGYPPYTMPYLACLHSSSIECSAHCMECPDNIWNAVKSAGEKQRHHDSIGEIWPIDGGTNLAKDSGRHDLLLTGHEDGCIRFWDVSGVQMKLLYVLNTTKLFVNDFDGDAHHEEADADDEGWPPFKKVGAFDPYTDDQRFRITKMVVCPVSGHLMVGGMGGQVILYDLVGAKTSVELKSYEMDITEKLEGFEWKGGGPLQLKEGEFVSEEGMCPSHIAQLKPAAPVTALALQSSWWLFAAGSCHGFVVFDCRAEQVALVKCTVNPTDLANTGGAIQRRKSFAKSLRDSFRRIRSRRGSRRKPRGDDGEASGHKNESRSPGAASPSRFGDPVGGRLVDENRVDEAMLSMVKCLYFADTFLSDATHHSPTLWAGTNAGYIYVYSVTIPDEGNRGNSTVTTEIGKEIKLKHHAPVVSIFVTDRLGNPLGGYRSVEEEKQGDMTGQHSVVICSEEQFKVFSLPALRPKNKEKLTAVDGSRVRKIGLLRLKVGHDADTSLGHCMVCLTNQGDATAYSVPSLKLHLKANVVKKEDISAIQSLMFTETGQGFFLKSPSEIQRFSLLADDVVRTHCILELPEGMRPSEDSDDDDDYEERRAAYRAQVEREEGEGQAEEPSSRDASNKEDEEVETKDDEEKDDKPSSADVKSSSADVDATEATGNSVAEQIKTETDGIRHNEVTVSS